MSKFYQGASQESVGSLRSPKRTDMNIGNENQLRLARLKGAIGNATKLGIAVVDKVAEAQDAAAKKKTQSDLENQKKIDAAHALRADQLTQSLGSNIQSNIYKEHGEASYGLSDSKITDSVDQGANDFYDNHKGEDENFNRILRETLDRKKAAVQGGILKHHKKMFDEKIVTDYKISVQDALKGYNGDVKVAMSTLKGATEAAGVALGNQTAIKKAQQEAIMQVAVNDDKVYESAIANGTFDGVEDEAKVKAYLKRGYDSRAATRYKATEKDWLASVNAKAMSGVYMTPQDIESDIRSTGKELNIDPVLIEQQVVVKQKQGLDRTTAYAQLSSILDGDNSTKGSFIGQTKGVVDAAFSLNTGIPLEAIHLGSLGSPEGSSSLDSIIKFGKVAKTVPQDIKKFLNSPVAASDVNGAANVVSVYRAVSKQDPKGLGMYFEPKTVGRIEAMGIMLSDPTLKKNGQLDPALFSEAVKQFDEAHRVGIDGQSTFSNKLSILNKMNDNESIRTKFLKESLDAPWTTEDSIAGSFMGKTKATIFSMYAAAHPTKSADDVIDYVNNYVDNSFTNAKVNGIHTTMPNDWTVNVEEDFNTYLGSKGISEVSGYSLRPSSDYYASNTVDIVLNGVVQSSINKAEFQQGISQGKAMKHTEDFAKGQAKRAEYKRVRSALQGMEEARRNIMNVFDY